MGIGSKIPLHLPGGGSDQVILEKVHDVVIHNLQNNVAAPPGEEAVELEVVVYQILGRGFLQQQGFMGRDVFLQLGNDGLS